MRDSHFQILWTTYNIDPRPGIWVIAVIWALTENDEDHDRDADYRAPEKACYRLANFLMARDLEPPDEWPELCIRDEAKDDSM